MSAALTLYLFPFFSSKIPLSYLFFLLLLFLNTFFLFPYFQIPNTVVPPPPIHGKGPFIVPVVTKFYYFGPQQPLSGLGVLADHHWFVCMPLLSLDKKKKLFYLFVCHDNLSCYGLGAFSLPIPHGMHLVVPTQFCFFWVV